MIKLKDIISENINEVRPATHREVKDWIEGFNNAVYLKNAAGYFLFKASKFALKGIKRELKDTKIRIRHFPKGAYGIPVSQKNEFHWGVNESITEARHIDINFAQKHAANYNSGKLTWGSAVEKIVKDLGYKPTRVNINLAGNHIAASSNGFDKMIEDRDVYVELYDILK